MSRDYGSFLVVHGAISNPDKYVTGEFEAEPEFDYMGDASVCFFGHTHVPALYSSANNEPPDMRAKIVLDSGAKYLINPGSVGQPRDMDPRASYLIFDTRGAVEFRRVSYDVEKAQRKILDSGLPRVLADRLTYGY